jgi:ketosteroid isomerase-like protein
MKSGPGLNPGGPSAPRSVSSRSPFAACTLRHVAHDNVEIVRAVLGAWNESRLDSVSHLISDDITWLEVGGRLESVGSELKGRGNVLAGMDSEVWQSYRLEPETVVELKGRVLAILREIGRGRASGLEVEGRWGYVITVRDGKIERVEAYRDPRAALDAAGVSEREIHEAAS